MINDLIKFRKDFSGFVGDDSDLVDGCVDLLKCIDFSNLETTDYSLPSMGSISVLSGGFESVIHSFISKKGHLCSLTFRRSITNNSLCCRMDTLLIPLSFSRKKEMDEKYKYYVDSKIFSIYNNKRSIGDYLYLKEEFLTETPLARCVKKISREGLVDWLIEFDKEISIEEINNSAISGYTPSYDVNNKSLNSLDKNNLFVLDLTKERNKGSEIKLGTDSLSSSNSFN